MSLFCVALFTVAVIIVADFTVYLRVMVNVPRWTTEYSFSQGSSAGRTMCQTSFIAATSPMTKLWRDGWTTRGHLGRHLWLCTNWLVLLVNIFDTVLLIFIDLLLIIIDFINFIDLINNKTRKTEIIVELLFHTFCQCNRRDKKNANKLSLYAVKFNKE